MKTFSTTAILILVSTLSFAKLKTPVLAEPDDKSTNQPSSVKIRVETVNSGKEYVFQYSDASDMSNATTVTHEYISSYSSYVWMRKLKLNKTYYWRVRARGTTDSSDWSKIWSFTTNDSVMFYSPRKSGYTFNPGTQFAWYRTANIDSVQLQYDTTSTFNSPHLKDVTVKDTFSDFYGFHAAHTLHYGKRYYVRFRGLQGTKTTNWSEAYYGTLPDTVRILQPVDLYNNSPVALTFKWAGISYKHFQLQLDSSPNFNSPLLIDSVGTEGPYRDIIVGDLHYNTKYYWRVRAIAHDTTPWVGRSFTTAGLENRWTTADYISAPTAEVRISQQIQGSKGYIFQIDTSDQFNSSQLQELDSPNTKAYFKELDFGQSYFARSKPYHSKDTGAWSNVRLFNIIRSPSTNYPSSNAKNIDIEGKLTWRNREEGVTGYQLQLSESQNFDGALIIDSIMSNDYTSFDRKIDGFTLKFAKTYYWRMRMWHAKDTSEWDFINGKSFTTINQTTLTSPYNSDFSGRAVTEEFEWESINLASKYRILLDTSESFNSPALIDTTTKTNSIMLKDLYFGSTYRWKVQAIYQDDTTDWSETWLYKTADKVRLDRPKQNNTSVFRYMQSFDWNSITGTKGYILQLDTSPNFTNPVVLADTGKNPFFHYFHTPAPVEYDMQYYWRVKVYHNYDTTEWSDAWMFKVAPRIAPYLTYPKDSSVDIPLGISFRWEANLKASSYLISYADNPNFVGAQQLTVAGTSRAVALKPNTTYYWNVRSKDDKGNWIGDWSEIWMFTTKTAMDVPTLISPANGFQDAGLTQTVKWNVISGANFDVQLDDNVAFSSPSTISTPTSSRTFGGLKGKTTYYWRVRAKNVFTTGAWSDAWSFNTEHDLGIHENFEKTTIVYPNPALDFVNVSCVNGQPLTAYVLTSSDGKIVLHGDVSTTGLTLDLHDLSSGLYVLTLKSGNSLVKRKINVLNAN